MERRERRIGGWGWSEEWRWTARIWRWGGGGGGNGGVGKKSEWGERRKWREKKEQNSPFFVESFGSEERVWRWRWRWREQRLGS